MCAYSLYIYIAFIYISYISIYIYITYLGMNKPSKTWVDMAINSALWESNTCNLPYPAEFL